MLFSDFYWLSSSGPWAKSQVSPLLQVPVSMKYLHNFVFARPKRHKTYNRSAIKPYSLQIGHNSEKYDLYEV